jgi:hypothetical protein
MTLVGVISLSLISLLGCAPAPEPFAEEGSSTEADFAAAGMGFAGDNPLIGTWELVSVAGTRADGTTIDWQVERDGGRSIKIYSETHFSVVTHGADGAFRNAQAGPYVLKDNTLTETLRNASNPDTVDREVVHEVSVTADLSTNSYVQRNGTKTKEVWKRVK